MHSAVRVGDEGSVPSPMATIVLSDSVGVLKEDSREILFSWNPPELDIEAGTEPGRLRMQRHEMRRLEAVLPAHLADHQFRIATD